MVSVGMKSTKYTPTDLARDLIKSLLDMASTSGTPPGHVCRVTGEKIKGMDAYHVIKSINKNACGPFYSVFGYYYILCMYPIQKTKYVAVHKAASGMLVGFTNKNALR